MTKNKQSASPKITLEKVARDAEEQFLELQGDIRNTQSEVRALREEMKREFADFRTEVKEVVKDGVREIAEEVQKINYAKEIDELRSRVKRLEQKVGMK